MLRIIDEMLTQNNDNSNCESDSRIYALIVIDQLNQLRHSREDKY